MDALLIYLFRSTVWLTAFALVFILFLKNERFFLLNRIYLLTGILASFILPFVSLHYTVMIQVSSAVSIQSAVQMQADHDNNSLIVNLKQGLYILYLAGVLSVILLSVKSAYRILRLIRKSGMSSSDPVRLIRTDDNTSPFSFFSFVFVNKSLTGIEAREIIIHEMVHIRQKHWFDLLLVELLRILQWFNPLVWSYIRYVRQNHEYLADQAALKQTADPAIYKAVLLNQIIGAPIISFSNSFNYSPNKKRFNMMKNIFTSPYRKMKVMLVLPLAAFVMYAFATPEYKVKYIENEKIAIADTTKQIKKDKQKSISVKVTSDKGKKRHEPAIVINDDGSTPLYVVDGVEVSKSKAEEIDPENIYSISVIKDEKDTKYGKKGEHGVVEITTKEAASTGNEITVTAETNVKVEKATPIIIIDGVEKDVDPATVNQDNVESVYVLTDKTATDKYGERAKDGVVEIKMKKNITTASSTEESPLFIVDGKEYKGSLNNLDSETIESMTVWKSEKAIEKYGDRGKNGVIEIVLKKSDK
jgi:beta-lactamase regulating signal transducer with metallopeptidase domain